jgi:hypothetical protein
MQKERELQRKQVQARKDAEAQARLLVLKVGSHGMLFHHLFVRFYFRKNANEH